VFCANDDMALGLIHALATAGRSVPGDLSIVGFDDTPAARHSLPPLTTVHQDFAAVGARAVELMLAARDGLDAPSHELIAPTLVERLSTAAPCG
jgi:DNA-binding LacI/PurR family transcriptional regulator